MTHLKYYGLKRILDRLLIEETFNLLEAIDLFCCLGYGFDLQKLEQGIIEVYPLKDEFYIIEFTGYKVELKGY